MQPVSTKTITWYRRRWFKITIIVTVAIIVLSGLGAAMAYHLWQSRPEKVLYDAANYATMTPATYTVTSADTNISVGVKNQRFSVTGTIKGVPVSAIYSENSLYFKSPQPEKLYDAYFAGSVPSSFGSTITSVLANFKNRWISIDLYKIPLQGSSLGAAFCGIESFSQVTKPTTSQLQIGTIYAANPFLDAKTLSASPIQSVYQLHIDTPKFKSFYDATSKTAGYESNQECAGTINSLTKSDIIDATAQVTVTKSDRHLRSVSIINKSGAVTKISADYTKSPNITIPTDVTTYDQIVNTLLKSFLPSFFGVQ